jgi:hypothetical protein
MLQLNDAIDRVYKEAAVGAQKTWVENLAQSVRHFASELELTKLVGKDEFLYALEHAIV